MYKDSLDAREAHVQWGANEGYISRSPPVTSREPVVPEDPAFAGDKVRPVTGTKS